MEWGNKLLSTATTGQPTSEISLNISYTNTTYIICVTNYMNDTTNYSRDSYWINYISQTDKTVSKFYTYSYAKSVSKRPIYLFWITIGS